jgi:hypothetical protein
MERLEHFREWLTDWWRPFHLSCLPDDLALPEDGATVWDAAKMLRDARLGASCDLELGVFQILGVDEARRAACIWSPKARLICEEVALAFRLVERQRLTGEIVSGHNTSRLTEALFAYFTSMGRRKPRDEIRRQIDAFLGERALPDAEAMSPVRQPITIDLPLLDELRAIDKEVQAKFIGMHNRPATLECIGLILDAELDASRYDHITPLNCRTFAYTGGDGAHFSLLVLEGTISKRSPVVLTSGAPSMVLAESLVDFLNLGCQKGYFALGNLSAEEDLTWKEYIGPDGESPISEFLSADYQYHVLAYLRDRLGLRPWTDWRRMRDIQSRYASHLRYPPDALF